MIVIEPLIVINCIAVGKMRVRELDTSKQTKWHSDSRSPSRAGSQCGNIPVLLMLAVMLEAGQLMG